MPVASSIAAGLITTGWSFWDNADQYRGKVEMPFSRQVMDFIGRAQSAA